MFIGDAQRDVARRQAVEQHRQIVAKADVLRALADVEGDGRFALAGVAAVELNDAIFDFEPRQRRRQRRLVEEAEIEPAIGDVARRDGLLRPRAHAEAVRSARPHALALRALDLQRRRDARFVAHLDEERAPSVLHELRLRGARGHLDAALGIDVDVEQRVAIENLLHRGGRARMRGLASARVERRRVRRFAHRRIERLTIRRRERRADVVERFDEARDLRRERLQLDRDRRRRSRSGARVGVGEWNRCRQERAGRGERAGDEQEPLEAGHDGCIVPPPSLHAATPATGCSTVLSAAAPA